MWIEKKRTIAHCHWLAMEFDSCEKSLCSMISTVRNTKDQYYIYKCLPKNGQRIIHLSK